MAANLTDAKRRAHVDRQRARLPEDPGVYTYYDTDGAVLYVGKARNLKRRVNSYFTKSHDAKTHALVMRIAEIEVLVLSSEAEALMVENNLIKRHHPPFNVMLRDDKSYPFIAVTVGDEYPRVIFTRERHRAGTKYYGPYSNAKRVRATLDLLNRIFPYRPCEGPTPGRQSGIPCLDFHIERCAAPCIGNISQDDYRVVINQVMEVLEGRATSVRSKLTAQMAEAASSLEFERAARLRNRIRELDEVIALQAAERPGSGSFDVIAVAVRSPEEAAELAAQMQKARAARGLQDDDPALAELPGGAANVQVLQVRDGHLTDRRSHFLDNAEGVAAGTVLTQFILSYYEPGRPIPAQIVVPEGALSEEDVTLLTEELSRVRESAVEVRVAQRGDKRRMAQLAATNADHALRYDSLKERAKVERRTHALEELRDELGLDALPLRIECYDISNLGEEHPVASMVVLEDGIPRKDHYRKFAMQHAEGQDDFAMMGEVIRRRFTRLASAQGGEDDDEDESFASTPNLVVIDGGKGQLGKALESLTELGVERVNLCSLAKREEEVFLPGRPTPIVLDRHSHALHMLQRIRNEAHRFALGFHRTRRANDERQRSVLDTLEGVGPARRRALLTFFGSPERVIAATLDELEAVPGLPPKVARRIHEQLHRLN